MPSTLPDHVKAALLDAELIEEDIDHAGASPSMPVSPGATATASPDFVPPPWFARLEFAMTGPGNRGAIISGPRGSGKTTTLHQLSRIKRATLITFQAAAGCTIDDLVGIRDLRDGRTIFSPGPLADALVADSWLLIEEANVMHPGVFSKLNTLTDNSGDVLRLPDGNVLSVGPGFRVALAFNEGAAYAGTREVNAALRDRLMPIYAGYLPESAEIQLLIGRTGCDRKTAKRVAKLANKVRAARANLNFDLSPRALFGLLDLIKHQQESWAEAFEHAILDRVGDPLDRQPQREAISKIADLDDLTKWPAPTWGAKP